MESVNVNKFLTLLFLIIFSQELSAEEWVYLNPINPKEVFVIETHPNSFGINDVRQKAEFCEEDDLFTCVKTDGFEFFIPKDANLSTKTWTANGHEYRISSTYERTGILGIHGDIYLIEKKTDSGAISYLYSTVKGLIGIGGYSSNGKVSSFFILGKECGFGASDACQRSPIRNPD